jgi:hypothetical protein
MLTNIVRIQNNILYTGRLHFLLLFKHENIIKILLSEIIFFEDFSSQRIDDYFYSKCN